MGKITWEYREEDKEFFYRELDSFVPGKVYDMHAHLWRESDFEGKASPLIRIAPSEITMEVYRKHMEWILPEREVHGLHFALPASFPNNPVPPNTWVSQEIKKDPLSRGQFYVRPTDDPEWVRQEVKRLGFRGLKPFASFAARSDFENAEIPEYFPDRIAALANEEGWSVTLHIQRARSLADPSNLHWIRAYCEKYPNMVLILDHSARGFNPYHCLEGMEKLSPADLDNLYFDTSVNCAPLATMACLHYHGPGHLLYASDFIVSHQRGTNLAVGDSFLWLNQDSYNWDQVQYKKQPLLIGLENLRAVKAAFHMLHLGDNEIESYFWGNAAKVLDL